MVMADVERLFATRARFDAATSTRQFVLHTADYGQQMLGRAIAAELAEHAPDTRLHFRPLSDELIAGASDALRNVDGFVLPLGFVDGLPHLAAYQDRWVLMVDRDNDLVGDAVTLDELSELEWVSAFHREGSYVPAVRQLQLLGVSVRVVVDLEGFASLPWFVKGTNRITMIQERLAHRIAPAAEFRVLECPFEAVPLVEAMWWHPSLDHDPGHVWFRTIVERAGRRIQAEVPALRLSRRPTSASDDVGHQRFALFRRRARWYLAVEREGVDSRMFAYFPGNYVWNLSVCIALESGAQIGEIDEMCAPLREAAAQGDDPGTADFLQSWVAMADKLVGLADEDAATRSRVRRRGQARSGRALLPDRGTHAGPRQQ